MEEDNYVWPVNEQLIYVRPPNESYHGDLLDFYSPKCFPELQILEQNWKKIRAEVLAYEAKKGQIQGMDTYSPSEVTGGTWGNIILKHFMWKFFWNMKNFPVTTNIIESIPNCSFAAFSVLYPNTHIQPHYGDTNGIIRVHLGLVIPDKYPTIGLKVNGVGNGLEEGKLLCYPDVKRHEAWNYSNLKRYILIVDIIPKPLIDRAIEICSKTLGSQSFIFFYKKLIIVRYLPKIFQDGVVAIFSLFWKIYLTIQAIWEK